MRTHVGEHEQAPVFLERYYDTYRRQRCARFAGRLAVKESRGLDQRFNDEMTSGFAEALAGYVHTEYDFDVHEGKLAAGDGEPLETMMLRARRTAYEQVAIDPCMKFMADRFDAEIDELHDQQSMAVGVYEHNTIITLSPYTEELIDQPQLLKRGFQKPEYLRSMLRISHWDGARVHILTRSLDSSTVALLRTTAQDALGYEYMAHDSLGVLRERIKGTYSLEEVRAVADTICNGFDSALHKQRGGVYKQGRDLSSMKNLEQFVSSRPEVIEHLKAESKVHARTAKSYDEFRTLLDGSLHKHLALLQQMLEGRSINHSNIGDAADYAGGLATSAGVSYDMCGYVVNSPEKPQSQSTLGTGFESLMAYAGVRLQCPNNRCGEFVVVDIRYLKQGVLHCTACLHTLDVCGDTRKAERIKAEALKKRKETNAKRAEKQKRTEWRHKKRNTSRHVTL